MASIGELFIALGFDVDDKTLKSFDKGVKELKDDFFDVSAGSVAALYSFDKFIEKTSQGAIAISDFHQRTGESMESLQEWAKAAHNADILFPESAAQASIEKFKQNMTAVSLGKGGSYWGFGMLNAVPQKDENEFSVLERMRKGVQQKLAERIDRAKITQYISDTGLAPNFANLLTAPQKQFDDSMKRGREYSQTPQQIGQLKKLGEEFDDLKQKWENFIKVFTASHSSEISDFIKDLDTVGTHLSNDIKAINNYKTAMEALGVILLTVARPMLIIAGASAYLIDAFGNSQGGIKGFKKDLASLARPDVQAGMADVVGDIVRANINKLLGTSIPQQVYQNPNSAAPETIEQYNTFHINGAKDPYDTGHKVKEAIQGAYNHAYQQQNFSA